MERLRQEAGTSKCLGDCHDALTSGLSPKQEHAPWQANLVGTPSRKRRASSQHRPSAPSWPGLLPLHLPEPDRQTGPRRQLTPLYPQALAAPTSIPVWSALHLQQTGYLYLSGKGAGVPKSLPASCSWQHSNYFLSWVLPATGTLAGATINNWPCTPASHGGWPRCPRRERDCPGPGPQEVAHPFVNLN